MEKNNKTKRKLAAVLLGIVGVAGLSVASASTLTVDTENEVALGTASFEACDTDGVTVDYDYVKSGTAYNITNFAVKSIDTDCNGEDVQVSLTTAGNTALASGSGTVAAGAASITLDTTVPVSTDLGDVTVIIGDSLVTVP